MRLKSAQDSPRPFAAPGAHFGHVLDRSLESLVQTTAMNVDAAFTSLSVSFNLTYALKPSILTGLAFISFSKEFTSARHIKPIP